MDLVYLTEDRTFMIVIGGFLFLIVVLLSMIVVMMYSDPKKLSVGYLIKSFTSQVTGRGSKDEMLEHEYDGIRELDNPIPGYLRFMMYGSVIFGFAYIMHYHILGSGNSIIQDYEEELRIAEETYKDVELADELLVQMDAEGDLAQGKTIFLETCAPCHGNLGEGLTAPNLTDAYWLHGGGVKDLYQTVTEGVPGKGMISWRNQITSKDRLRVVSFIMTMAGSNPPGGREPEGELYQSENSTQASPDSTANDVDSTSSLSN